LRNKAKSGGEQALIEQQVQGGETLCLWCNKKRRPGRLFLLLNQVLLRWRSALVCREGIIFSFIKHEICGVASTSSIVNRVVG